MRRGYTLFFIVYFIDLLFIYDFTEDIVVTTVIAGSIYFYINTISELVARHNYQTKSIECISNISQRKKLTDAFEYTQTLIKGINMPNIKLYYIDSQDINALTLGKHSIAVTQGLLDVGDRSTLVSILSHELGHIYNGDLFNEHLMLINLMALIALLVVFNVMLVGSFWLIILLISFIGICRFGFFTLMLGKGLSHMSNWIIKGFQNTLIFITNVVARFIGRQNEYSADLFSIKLHPQNGLYLKRFLSRYDNKINTNSFIDILYSTHPSNDKRIERIDKYMENCIK